MENDFVVPFLLSLIAGLSTVLGTIFIFINIKKVKEFITLSLAFSFTIMILISIFDLLPTSIVSVVGEFGKFWGLFICVIVFMLGSIFIRKVNEKIRKHNKSSLYNVGILSLISLFAHNIPEGIAVFISAYSNINLGISLCLAIMLHNIPEGIVISVPLYHSSVKRSRVVLYTLLSGLSEPLGAIIGYIFLRHVFSNNLISIVLIFVAGLMIDLSLNDILNEALTYKKRKYLIFGITLAIFIFIIANLI